ncbi:MAG: spore cortex biosynthesis protein YabQ [Turicibacter sp.]|nr:spore cortex biosynthesis protein YabQ [Turicibacter sp.]
MNLHTQFDLFIHMILYGAFIGITYDGVNIIKGDMRHKPNRVITMVIYWSILVPLTYLYLYNVNQGQMHMFVFVSLFIGNGLYFKLMKRQFRNDLEMLGKNIYFILGVIKKVANVIIISPILFIYRLFSDIIKWILKLLKFIFVTPLVNLGKWGSKKKVNKRVKKANGHQEEQTTET